MSDIVGEDEPLFQIICNKCKHHFWNVDTSSCAAFDNIPNEILDGDNDHSKPLPGQKNDIVFEPEE